MNARNLIVVSLVLSLVSTVVWAEDEGDDNTESTPARLFHPVLTEAQTRGFIQGCMGQIEVGPMFQTEGALIGTLLKSCSSDAEIEVGILARNTETDEVMLITGKVSVTADEEMAVFTCTLPDNVTTTLDIVSVRVLKVVRLLSI